MGYVEPPPDHGTKQVFSDDGSSEKQNTLVASMGDRRLVVCCSGPEGIISTDIMRKHKLNHKKNMHRYGMSITVPRAFKILFISILIPTQIVTFPHQTLRVSCPWFAVSSPTRKGQCSQTISWFIGILVGLFSSKATV